MIRFSSELPTDLSLLDLFSKEHPEQLRWPLDIKVNNFYHPNAMYFYQLLDDKMIGEAILGWIDDVTINVDSYTILSDYKGQGYGSMLLNEVIDWSRNNGFKELTATARQGASLRSFLSFGAEVTDVKYDWAETGENYVGIFIKLS